MGGVVGHGMGEKVTQNTVFNISISSQPALIQPKVIRRRWRQRRLGLGAKQATGINGQLHFQKRLVLLLGQCDQGLHQQTIRATHEHPLDRPAHADKQQFVDALLHGSAA